MSPHDSTHADPAPAIPGPLRSRLQQVAETLVQITGHIARATAADIPQILAGNRTEFYGVMNSLGFGILDFLAEDPSPAQIDAVRAQVVTPIRAWSATSPIFNRTFRSTPTGPHDFEIPAMVIQNRGAGADLSSWVLNDFYLHSIAAKALRNRYAMLIARLLREVTLRTQAGINPVQVLNLKCDAGNELLTLAEEPEFALTEITCLDEDSTALRAARAKLEKRLPTQAWFLRVGAMRYAQSPMRRLQHYDISYAAILLDHLTDRQVVALVRACHDLLAADGVLILGSPTSGVPASERALIAWVMDLVVHYRDEPDFQRLFAQTPFGSEMLCFEREPVGGDLLISATRS
jgi:SAM-dependent methyltransferase